MNSFKIHMKNILFLLVACTLTNALHSQSDQDKAKAYFFEAKDQFEAKKYSDCLSTLNNVENLLGETNPLILNLKVKAFYHSGDYQKAKASLNLYSQYSSNASAEIQKETLSYIVKVDEKLNEQALIEEQNRRKIAEAQRREAEIERKRVEKQKDFESWQKAKSQNTKNAYNEYLIDYPNGKYRFDAKKSINKIEKEILNEQERRAFELVRNTNSLDKINEFIEKFPNGTHYIKALKIKQVLEVDREFNLIKEEWEEALKENTCITFQNIYHKTFDYSDESNHEFLKKNNPYFETLLKYHIEAERKMELLVPTFTPTNIIEHMHLDLSQIKLTRKEKKDYAGHGINELFFTVEDYFKGYIISEYYDIIWDFNNIENALELKASIEKNLNSYDHKLLRRGRRCGNYRFVIYIPENISDTKYLDIRFKIKVKIKEPKDYVGVEVHHINNGIQSLGTLGTAYFSDDYTYHSLGDDNTYHEVRILKLNNIIHLCVDNNYTDSLFLGDRSVNNFLLGISRSIREKKSSCFLKDLTISVFQN